MKKNKKQKSKIREELKWYTLDEVFKKSSRTKEFKRAYKEEFAKLQVAKQIQDARKKKKLTQAKVAQKAGMPQSVIARIESGNHGISFDTLAKVAHALGKEVKIV